MVERVELGAVLAQMVQTGRLSKSDKRWVRQQIETQRKHERNMKMLSVIEHNEDMPYIIMFLGGAAGVAIMQLIKKLENPDATEAEKKTWQAQLAELTENFLDIQSFLSGGLGGWALQELAIGDKLEKLYEDKAPSNWVEFATTAAQSTAAGISAFGASMLVMRAIFGGSTSKDGGVMAQLAGLVI